MKDLILLIVPNILIVEKHLQYLEKNRPTNYPKGISALGYHSNLLEEKGSKDVPLIVCPEDQFTNFLQLYLSEIVNNKRWVFLSFHKACSKVESQEKALFQIGQQKIQFPVKNDIFSSNSPVDQLLSDCCKYAALNKKNEFGKAIINYRNQFEFDIELEAAFCLANIAHDKQQLLQFLSLKQDAARLDKKITDLLFHTKVMRIFQNSKQDVSNMTIDQYAAFCKTLFNPHLFDKKI